MRKILLVEDDPKIQFANKIILELRDYKVLLAYDLKTARKIVAETPPDIIILDIMLPDGSGLDFLRELRQGKLTPSGSFANIPVLLLTALDTSQDVVDGLAAGGDDYLAKPYDNNVLLWRIEAILRRSYNVPEQLTLGDITINTASQKVYVNGTDLLVSPKEYSLLVQFVQNPGSIMSMEALYEKVWGQKILGDNHTLKNAISSLRKRLVESKAGYTITSARVKGYYLEKL